MEALVKAHHIVTPFDLDRREAGFLAGFKINGRVLGQRGQKMVANLLAATKEISLAKFIRGLAIPLLGATSSPEIADSCKDDVENFTSVETDDAYAKARDFFSTLMEQGDEEE